MEKLNQVVGYSEKIPKFNTAEEVSEKTGVTVERLLMFCEAGYCPHYRVDGGPPQFVWSEVKEWVARNLVYKSTGHEAPLHFQLFFVDKNLKKIQDPPDVLKITNLRQIPIEVYPPGVYFLCKKNEVVYVGQSVNVVGRIYEHQKQKDFDRIYMIPVSRQDLDRVEASFINLLRPKLNGNKGALITESDRIYFRENYIEPEVA